MEYKNKLVSDLISILDKRTYLAKQELNKVINFVKSYDTSITNYINDDQIRQDNSINNKFDNLSRKQLNDINTLTNNIDNKIRSIKSELNKNIRDTESSLELSITNNKQVTYDYIDEQIENTNRNINNIDSKYKGKVDDLSSRTDTSINDLYTKLTDGIDDLYQKYDASIKDISNRLDSSFRNMIHYIDTSVAILREQTITNAKILEDNLNASINRIKGGINTDITNVYDYIDDQLDDVDNKFDDIKKEQNIQNISINNISSNVDIKYNYLESLIKKSSGEMGDVVVDGIAGVNKKLEELNLTLNNNYNTITSEINNTNTKVTSLENDTAVISEKLKKHITDSDEYQVKTNASIAKINSSLNNLEIFTNNLKTTVSSHTDDIDELKKNVQKNTETLEIVNPSINILENTTKQINTNLTTLNNNFNKVVNSEDANEVIDTFKEVENFLDSISDASTLTEMLKSMSDDINNNIDKKIKELNASITNIKGDITGGVSIDIDSIKDKIEIIDTSINNINSSLLNISTILNTSINEVYNYVNNTIIDNINSSFNNINSSLLDISIKFNEFKKSVTNNNSSINEIIKKINSSISIIDNSIGYIDTSVVNISNKLNNTINTLSNTTSRVATIELNNITSLNNISGTDENIWDDDNNEINQNSYVIDTNTFNITENGVKSTKEVKTVNSNIIKEIIKNEKSSVSILNNINSSINTINTSVNTLESTMDSIKSDLNNIDVLNTEYINKKNDETINGFNTIGTCFDFIIDNMYYSKPVNINVTFNVSPDNIIKGKRTNVTFTYKINNYTEYIESIKYNNVDIKDLEHTESMTISDNISRNLFVKTNYKDKKGVYPSNNPVNIIKTVIATPELYYWSSDNTVFESSYTSLNKPNWSLYKGTSFTFDNNDVNKYIFFVSILNKQESEFFIYKHGSSPTLGGGITNLGTVKIKMYDDTLIYYLYRTNNVLGGNYDIKF